MWLAVRIGHDTFRLSLLEVKYELDKVRIYVLGYLVLLLVKAIEMLGSYHEHKYTPGISCTH